jgi:ATP/maltotriose-dependent transcriptional regulator MalT
MRARARSDAELSGVSDPGGILEGMTARVTSPVLVGRAEQTGQLRSAFGQVRDGSPATVLVGGEAGIGKSRLVGEFTAAITGGDARVLVGGCLELGADGLPFAPFTAVLRDLVRELGADAVAGMLPGRATRELARLLPELGEPDAGGDPGEARARLFEQVLVLLERLAEPAPVILVIEDAHWADRSSRDLLAFLIRNQRALGRVLIVVSYRSDELHRTHPLRPLIAELTRIDWVERMDLPRLTRREAGELVGRILGRAPDPAYVDRLYRRTEGNPFFLETLLDCADDANYELQLPDSLRDLLLINVQKLPEESQEVLRVASAGGERVGHGLLAAVTGLGSDGLTRALRPAVTANTLSTEDDAYVFRHALIREAVHEDLLPGEHGRVHARFAEAIDADPSLVPPHRAAIEMAHHWYSAHNVTWALISAWQAAAQAGKAVAHAERLTLLARVLELWDQVPDAAERIGADHARVLEEAVQAAEDAGESERGIAFASAALKELDPDEDQVRVALMLHMRAGFGQRLGRPGDAEDLEQALALVPAEVSPSARARILLACGKFGSRHEARDKAAAQEALTLARQAGDAGLEASALMTLALIAADPGGMASPGSESLELLARARAFAEQAKAYPPLLRAAINESHLLEGAGEHEAAATVARQGIARAEAYGLSRTSGTFLAINLAEPLLALGRWDEAIEVIERATELSPPPLHGSSLHVVAGLIAVARGDLGTAAGSAAAARAVLAVAPFKDQHHLPLTLLETELRLAAGDAAGAMAATGDAFDRLDLPASSPRYVWPVLVAGARACAVAVRAGQAGQIGQGGQAGQTGQPGDGSRPDAAAALMARLRGHADKIDSFGPVQGAHRLTFTAQDLEVDRSAWDGAAAAWEAVQQPYPQADALFRAAGAAMTEGDRDGAAARLRRAAALADDLRLGPLGEEIARLSRRVRPGDERAAGAGGSAGAAAGGAGIEAPFGLTARELEVLRLVAEGRSNREIAGELFISAKTASVHVSNILGKLGVGSRGEAAATAHRLRLFDDSPGP